MRKRKSERRNRFIEVIEQIRRVSNEIRPEEYSLSKLAVDESDLSTKRLEELHRQLQSLQKEKVGFDFLQNIRCHEASELILYSKLTFSKLTLLQSDRLKQVLEHLNVLNSLCLVLGVDFKQTVIEVHPSLEENEGSKNISNDTIERLASAIQRLRELKIQRMQKVIDKINSD